MADRHDDTPLNSKPWIACNTHVNQEQLAVLHLKRQKYDIYCPMFKKKLSHARRIEQVERPLFPGYVFIHADPVHDSWRPILSTTGIRSLIRFGEKIGTISDAFIQSLRGQEQDGCIATPDYTYHVGQRVQIKSGPFDGVVATILSMDEKQRLVVLMDLMQRHVRVKIPADQVSNV
jgi:transcriptional antiterminator RfaH